MLETEIAQDSSSDEKEMYHVNIDAGPDGKVQGLFEKSVIRGLIEALDNGIHH